MPLMHVRVRSRTTSLFWVKGAYLGTGLEHQIFVNKLIDSTVFLFVIMTIDW